MRIARNARYFTFLRDCPPQVDVVLGDARLSLLTAPDHEYHLIVLDAFSSDPIPVHLMTREELALYMEKLAPHGIVAFHISNRHLDLEPVLADLARDAGLIGRVRHQLDVPSADTASMKNRSVWAVLARQEADLGGLVKDPRWRPLSRQKGVGLWTDDFSNILAILRRE